MQRLEKTLIMTLVMLLLFPFGLLAAPEEESTPEEDLELTVVVDEKSPN